MYIPASPLALIVLIHDISLVIGGKLHSESLNVLTFLYWRQIYSRNIQFFSLQASGSRIAVALADTYRMFTKT